MSHTSFPVVQCIGLQYSVLVVVVMTAVLKVGIPIAVGLLYLSVFLVGVLWCSIQNTVVQCIELQGNRCGPGRRHLNK